MTFLFFCQNKQNPSKQRNILKKMDALCRAVRRIRLSPEWMAHERGWNECADQYSGSELWGKIAGQCGTSYDHRGPVQHGSPFGIRYASFSDFDGPGLRAHEGIRSTRDKDAR